MAIGMAQAEGIEGVAFGDLFLTDVSRYCDVRLMSGYF
jgi:hypothetical protein